MNKTSAIIKELELYGPFSHEEYVKRMFDNFGLEAERFMDLVDAKVGTKSGQKEIYRTKNKNVDMSHLITLIAKCP